MRKIHGALAGLAGVYLVASCGAAPGTGPAGPAVGKGKAGGPDELARRFALLGAEPACTPTPGNCTAAGGFERGVFVFNVVDRTPLPDLSSITYLFGGYEYTGGGSVQFGVDAFDQPTVTNNTSLNGEPVDGPVDPGEEPPPAVFANPVIEVNLVTGVYTVDFEGSEPDGGGTVPLIVYNPGSCEFVTFPPP